MAILKMPRPIKKEHLLALRKKKKRFSDISIWGIFGQKSASNEIAMLYWGYLKNVNFYSD
jgi:hypothetical protein